MDYLSMGDLTIIVGIVSILLTLGIMAFLYAKQNLTKSLFGKFLLIMAIGVFSSAFPMGFMGIIFGFIPVLLSASIISLVFSKELK